MKKILVLGINGMLGFDIGLTLQSHNLDYQSLIYPQIDLVKISEAETILNDFDFDLLINCTAYTNVDGAEKKENKIIARKINTDALEMMVNVCRKKQAKLVHFSTDYVFDGEKETPYIEEDLVNPINYYGFTKAKGEWQVLAGGIKSLVIRTSWLFGHNGPNFVKSIIKNSSYQPFIAVVDDQKGSPTFTLDLAKKTVEMILNNIEGLYHVTNQESCSWFEYAKEIFKILDKKYKIYNCKTQDFPKPAQRPKNSCLDNNKLAQTGLKLLRTWQEALAEYLIEEKKKWQNV